MEKNTTGEMREGSPLDDDSVRPVSRRTPSSKAVPPALPEHRWDEATYAAFAEFRAAVDDFSHKMHASRVRTSPPNYVVEAWDVLGEAVGEFFDHLVERGDVTD